MGFTPFAGDGDEEPVAAEPQPEPAPARSDDAAIRALVKRLARPNATGGAVVERAALMAEGTSLDSVIAWIEAHDGRPELRPAAKPSGRGLHAARLSASADDRPPLRYVLPAGALAEPPSPD